MTTALLRDEAFMNRLADLVYQRIERKDKNKPPFIDSYQAAAIIRCSMNTFYKLKDKYPEMVDKDRPRRYIRETVERVAQARDSKYFR